MQSESSDSDHSLGNHPENRLSENEENHSESDSDVIVIDIPQHDFNNSEEEDLSNSYYTGTTQQSEDESEEDQIVIHMPEMRQASQTRIGAPRMVSFHDKVVVQHLESAQRIQLGGRKQTELTLADMNPQERNPSVFIEMQEYSMRGWAETYRWNYALQEDFLDDGWSQPHLPTVSMNAMYKLRQQFDETTLMFNVRGATRASVVNNMLTFLAEENPGHDEMVWQKIRSIILSPSRSQSQISLLQPGHDFGEEQNESFLLLKPDRDEESCDILVATLPKITTPIRLFGRLRHSVDFGCEGRSPVRYLMLLIGDASCRDEHVEMGKAMAAVMGDEVFIGQIQTVGDVGTFCDAFDDFSEKMAVVPHVGVGIDDEDDMGSVMSGDTNDATSGVHSSTGGGTHRHHKNNTERIIIEDVENMIRVRRKIRDDEKLKHDDICKEQGLVFSGKFAGGLIADVKRRWPFYVDDFKDGLHGKCLGAILFLFFACLAPAVAFGALMETYTDHIIGVSEMLVATAGCGIVYALVGGQPLMILGGTGPLLIFTGVLYDLCDSNNWDFLPVYAWVGIWIMIYSIILALTDASALIRYCTRFTDEIFAALISVIFVLTAIEDIRAYFIDDDTERSSALLSLVLSIGTCWIAMTLRKFKHSRFLHPMMREFLADFGSLIAMSSMAIIDHIILEDVKTEKVDAPDSVGTSTGRDWVVDIGSVDWYIPLIAAIPGLLAVLLVFLDNNITKHILAAPQHKLTRGAAYHYDTLIVGILIGICSMFGLPWLVAATVRSLNHLHALSITKEIVTRDGVKNEVAKVYDNRVTGFVIHFLVLLSLFSLKLVQEIPMPVIYGLFLYMGVVSLSSNQFIERLMLLFTQPRLYPSSHYVRWVPKKSIHLFTVIQAVCLILLFVVKSSPIAITFPLFIAVLVPLRSKLLPKWFTTRHLNLLDAEEAENDDEAEEYV
eukprot:TRINITY_DN9868_c0_g2_i1.p1 TRINITY_DN9868_c0_g2~~TRINITY_DN9868_c0_g2_i1.p1  ORF type:complete len:950 (+),score=326.52 TRINITY_DN9868_c0_g2_i1:44-2893(+)